MNPIFDLNNNLQSENSDMCDNETPTSLPRKIYMQTIARVKLEHGFLHAMERKHLEKRSKGYELLRVLEDCTKYHNDECSRELKIGESLGEELTSEFYRKRVDPNISIYSLSLRKYFERFLSEITSRRLSDGASFPWATYDENMQKNCMSLLQANRIDECRIYLIGYFEIICRVPTEFLSNQGKITAESGGWAIHRHPFGSAMATIRIAFSYIAKYVYTEEIIPQIMKGIVDSFVLISEQTWSLCWEKCAKACFQLQELLVEAIQHCLFLNCQYLPHILYGYDSRVLSTVTDWSLEVNSFDLVPMRQPLKLDDLYRLCGVPSKYHVYPAFSENSSAYHAASLSLSAEESCWYSISENPFHTVGKDIAVYKMAKTPVEVADIAVSILKSVSRVAADIVKSTETSSSLTSREPRETVSADELIPLLTLSFALYFRTPVRSQNSNYLRYQNPTSFLALLKFSEAYMPSHLSLREEGYAVTVNLSALQTLPI